MDPLRKPLEGAGPLNVLIRSRYVDPGEGKQVSISPKFTQEFKPSLEESLNGKAITVEVEVEHVSYQVSLHANLDISKRHRSGKGSTGSPPESGGV